MRTVAAFSILFASAASTAAEPKPTDRPIPTRDAAKAMKVPDGFRVSLFAGEPDIVQPIAFAFDDRGRMWVVECMSYPKWTRDGKGRDRVVILEDTDGDGTFDKKTVFLDDGANLSGIEIGFGGVWLCSSPNLLFLPILDGDKPGKAEVKLDGWNMIDTKHNIFNSLTWGPDGWLYGCNGIQAKAWVGTPNTPKEKRTYLDCGVWRYHPIRKVFEVFAHGTTNPFGLDFDDFGELFITNCVIDHLFHFVPNGHYERMYGQDANPNVFGLMKSCVDYRHWASGDWTQSRSTGVGGNKEHSDAGGGHAHSGCAIYLADNFPAEYRNTLFTANIHGNRLNNDGLARTPTGYKGVRRPDFLFANDSWFRGICVKAGPEGGLYVSDWSDTGECHNYDKVDASNGRIYRVVYKHAVPWKGDVSKLTDAELVKLQGSANDWIVRRSRRVLQERASAGTLAKETPGSLRKLFHEEQGVPARLRALWALEAIDKLTDQEVSELLTDRDEAVRAWGYRLAVSSNNRSTAQLLMSSNISTEQSPYVLSAAASAVASHFQAYTVYEPLARHKLIKEDPALSLLLWYGIERWFARVPESAFISLPGMENTLIRQNTVRYVLAQPMWPDHLTRLMKLVEESSDDAARFDILCGIRETLAGRKDVAAPPNWTGVYAKLIESKSVPLKHEAEAVAVLFGDKGAIAALLARITDTTAKAEERRRAIELLAPRKLPDFARTLQKLLGEPALRGSAIRALASFSDAGTPAALITAYPQFTPQEKTDAVQTLAARVSYAKELLAAVEKGLIPRAEVPIVAARQVLALNDKVLSSRLETVWGKISPVGKERTALIKKWKSLLTEDSLSKADAANGRMLFAKHCGACHKMFGEGQAVGPELTGSQRTSLDYVLENVLDPSAVVPREYQLINFTLADERVVGGIIVRETKETVIVRTVNDTLTIPAAEILVRKQTPLSIMPEGLLDQMKITEVRDLVAYLRAREQIPLPKR